MSRAQPVSSTEQDGSRIVPRAGLSHWLPRVSRMSASFAPAGRNRAACRYRIALLLEKRQQIGHGSADRSVFSNPSGISDMPVLLICSMFCFKIVSVTPLLRPSVTLAAVSATTNPVVVRPLSSMTT